MDSQHLEPERFDTVVVGGGQAGLATGYYLARLGRPFVILDAGQRIVITVSGNGLKDPETSMLGGHESVETSPRTADVAQAMNLTSS